MHSIVLLGDMAKVEAHVLLQDGAQVEAGFGLFGDSANLDVRSVHGLRRTYHRLENHFGRTRWNS